MSTGSAATEKGRRPAWFSAFFSSKNIFYLLRFHGLFRGPLGVESRAAGLGISPYLNVVLGLLGQAFDLLGLGFLARRRVFRAAHICLCGITDLVAVEFLQIFLALFLPFGREALLAFLYFEGLDVIGAVARNDFCVFLGFANRTLVILRSVS